MKDIIDKLLFIDTDNFFVQFFRYGIVGGIAAVVNIVMFYLFTEFFGFYYIFSNILAFTLGLITNYFLSVKYVFSKERKKDKKIEFIVHASIGIIGLCLDTLLVYLFTDKLNYYYMTSKIISTVIVFGYNFIARKMFHLIETKEK
jgi:putative flippase GtrA